MTEQDELNNTKARIQYYPSDSKIKQPYCMSFGDTTNTKVCDIRGWGHLTSPGGQGLTEDEAVTIQNQWAETICVALNSANALDCNKWDGKKCIDMLPEIMEMLEKTHEALIWTSTSRGKTEVEAENLINKLKKEQGDGTE